MDVPTWTYVVMFIYEFYHISVLIGNVPSFVVVTTLIEGTCSSAYGYFRIFLFYGLTDHQVAFDKGRTDEVFISNADVFQVEGFLVSLLNTFPAPFR